MDSTIMQKRTIGKQKVAIQTNTFPFRSNIRRRIFGPKWMHWNPESKKQKQEVHMYVLHVSQIKWFVFLATVLMMTRSLQNFRGSPKMTHKGPYWFYTRQRSRWFPLNIRFLYGVVVNQKKNRSGMQNESKCKIMYVETSTSFYVRIYT